MRNLIWAALVAVSLLVQGSDAWADSHRLFFQETQQLTPEQRAMLVRIVFGGEADPIDAGLHAQFWNQFSEGDRRAWIAAEGTEQSPAARILFFQRIETAFRQSLYETVVAGTTSRTEELDELRAQAPGSRSDPEDPWTQQIGRQDRLLDLGRLRAGHYQSRFPIVAFDKWNEARRALLQTDMLLRAEWVSLPVMSWPYPALHLTLDWTYPLAMHPAAMCPLPCGAWSLVHGFNDNSVVVIFHFDSASYASDLLQSSDARVGMNLMTDLLTSYQVSEQSSEEGTWQGYQSSVFRSSIKIENRPSYHVVRILFRDQLDDALVILGLSSRSMSEAERAFEQIEQAIHLN